MTNDPQRLDPCRLCIACRGMLHLPPCPIPPRAGAPIPAAPLLVCRAAHERGAAAAGVLLMLNDMDSPAKARAYVNALHAQPLQVLLDLLRWHTDRMIPSARAEWFSRLRGDPREAVDPTLCPAAQVWEAMHDRIGAKALLVVAMPIIRASMGVVAHVAWSRPPWMGPDAQVGGFPVVVRVCAPLDPVPPWEVATDVFTVEAEQRPWGVTCPDCTDLLPVLHAIHVVQQLAWGFQ